MTRVLPALALVIGVPILLLLWNRSTRNRQTRRLQITDRAGFGKNAWVAIVEVDEKRFLVGAGDHGVNLISELEHTSDYETSMELSSMGTIPPLSPVAVTEDTHEGPRNGLVRRLQLMTVRTSARPSWSSVREKQQ